MKETTYSKIGKRFGAMLLDGLIFGVISYALYALLAFAFTGDIDDALQILINKQTMMSHYNEELFFALTSFQNLINAAIIFLYYWTNTAGAHHATPGKRICHLMVVSENGLYASSTDCAVRASVFAFPSLVGGIIYLIAANDLGRVNLYVLVANVLIYGLDVLMLLVPLCNKKHRAIHDFMAGTSVVDAEEYDLEMAAKAAPEPKENPFEYHNPILENTPAPTPNPRPVEEEKEYTMPPAYVTKQQTPSEPAEDYDERTLPPVSRTRAHSILGITGEYANAQFPVDAPITFGRDTGKCDLCFSEAARGVSRVHCRLEMENGALYLTDLGATNGVMVNGVYELKNNMKMQLNPGDTFTLGNMEGFRVL